MSDVVLIHSDTEDVHARAVARCLGGLHAEVCVLDRDRCFVDWSIGCDGDEVVIHTAEGRWTADSIRSVLWRRDFIVEPAWVRWEGTTPQVARFLAEQRSIHVESAFRRLLATTPCINDIGSNRSCSSKALQHHVARRCGLPVPATYMGGDPRRAEEFARSLWDGGRRCCTKNVESSHVEIGGVKHARLTRLFHEADLPDLRGLPACPMIFQEYVEKKYEYRVTVVGREVYACRIDSQAAGGGTAIDWRHYNIPATPHFAADLDKTLQAKLIELVNDLRLTVRGGVRSSGPGRPSRHGITWTC